MEACAAGSMRDDQKGLGGGGWGVAGQLGGSGAWDSVGSNLGEMVAAGGKRLAGATGARGVLGVAEGVPGVRLRRQMEAFDVMGCQLLREEDRAALQALVVD